MNKTILTLVFLIWLSVAVFGQSYEGFYSAKFLALGADSSPLAEFEIQTNRAVVGKIIVDKSTIAIRGQVDSSGKLEASGSGNSTFYTLKADLSRDQKITLTSRLQTNVAGRQSNSQSYSQGTYSKIVKTSEKSNLALDSKKSELQVEQPNPLFEKTFFPEISRILVKKNDFFTTYNLEMMGGGENSERGFYFTIARPQNSAQKIWKAENIRFLNYVEKSENYTKINRFRTNYEMWLKNRNIVSGEIELISEDGRQMVFKINNLKIKNEAGEDFVTINGLIYCEISK